MQASYYYGLGYQVVLFIDYLKDDCTIDDEKVICCMHATSENIPFSPWPRLKSVCSWIFHVCCFHVAIKCSYQRLQPGKSLPCWYGSKRRSCSVWWYWQSTWMCSGKVSKFLSFTVVVSAKVRFLMVVTVSPKEQFVLSWIISVMGIAGKRGSNLISSKPITPNQMLNQVVYSTSLLE